MVVGIKANLADHVGRHRLHLRQQNLPVFIIRKNAESNIITLEARRGTCHLVLVRRADGPDPMH